MKTLAIATACCAIAVPALAASTQPRIVLSKPLPSLVRIGQRVVIKGHALRAGAHARAALQVRGLHPWTTVARARTGAHGAFTIRLHVAKSNPGPVSLRVALLANGRVVASTKVMQSAVGPKPVYCAPPVPPAVNIPVGSGWIVGGLYLEGGPYPGIFACEQQPYTIKAESTSGAVVASQQVAAGHSYTLVVPAGTYMLRASTCGSGSATVTAAHQTKADTICPVP